MSHPKRIYLDTNHWITLAKVHYGKETDPKLKVVYKKIKEASENGTAIFPISFFHIQDIMNDSNEKQKNMLIDYIVMISRGWVLKPYNLFVKKEIENSVFRRLNKPIICDVRSEIIGLGIVDITGNKFDLIPTNDNIKTLTKEEFERITKIIRSSDMLSSALKNYMVSDNFTKIRQMMNEEVDRMESIRVRKSLEKDKNKLYRECIAVYLVEIVVDVLARMIIKYGIPKEIILPMGRNNMENFLEDMPSTNTVFRLTYARDLLEGRSVESNDIIDINHLAGSIPYCDVVVAEKMFSNLAVQKHLDKKYHCVILSSLNELSEYI